MGLLVDPVTPELSLTKDNFVPHIMIDNICIQILDQQQFFQYAATSTDLQPKSGASMSTQTSFRGLTVLKGASY
ncbi:hypothetical protein Ahy_B01g054757 isoform E [Arachis hypogaea]|uniref:Uncharacterized protein n=1 Tax=Arachis hypogaea TaxID=3818 RepID=A0A445AU88_ARAHY|nr:hypothetical protein Ahy_B01g054757 isoform E [Arachis hypogaea]